MADIAITASSVVKTSGKSSAGIAGATVAAGQPVYKDSTDGSKLKPADASAEASADVVGIALNGASSGQPVKYLVHGVLGINAVASAGEVYCLSATAGGVAPAADLLASEYRTVLGIATSSSSLKVMINPSATAK